MSRAAPAEARLSLPWASIPLVVKSVECLKMLPVARTLKCSLRLVVTCIPTPSGEMPTPRATCDRGFAGAGAFFTAGTAWAPAAMGLGSTLTRLEDESNDWAEIAADAAKKAAQRKSVECFTERLL